MQISAKYYNGRSDIPVVPAPTEPATEPQLLRKPVVSGGQNDSLDQRGNISQCVFGTHALFMYINHRCQRDSYSCFE